MIVSWVKKWNPLFFNTCSWSIFWNIAFQNGLRPRIRSMIQCSFQRHTFIISMVHSHCTTSYVGDTTQHVEPPTKSNHLVGALNLVRKCAINPHHKCAVQIAHFYTKSTAPKWALLLATAPQCKLGRSFLNNQETQSEVTIRVCKCERLGMQLL